MDARRRILEGAIGRDYELADMALRCAVLGAVGIAGFAVGPLAFPRST
jgi:hypothetical protein